MTAPAKGEDWRETNQIVERAEGICDWSWQVFIQMKHGPKELHWSTLCVRSTREQRPTDFMIKKYQEMQVILHNLVMVDKHLCPTTGPILKGQAPQGDEWWMKEPSGSSQSNIV